MPSHSPHLIEMLNPRQLEVGHGFLGIEHNLLHLTFYGAPRSDVVLQPSVNLLDPNTPEVNLLAMRNDLTFSTIHHCMMLV